MKKKKEGKKINRLFFSRVSTKAGMLFIFIIALPLIAFGGLKIQSAGHNTQMVEGYAFFPSFGSLQSSGTSSGTSVCPPGLGADGCTKQIAPPHIPPGCYHNSSCLGNFNGKTCHDIIVCPSGTPSITPGQPHLALLNGNLNPRTCSLDLHTGSYVCSTGLFVDPRLTNQSISWNSTVSSGAGIIVNPSSGTTPAKIQITVPKAVCNGQQTIVLVASVIFTDTNNQSDSVKAYFSCNGDIFPSITPPAGCYYVQNKYCTIACPQSNPYCCPSKLVCPSTTPPFPKPTCISVTCVPGTPCPQIALCKPAPSVTLQPEPSCIPRPACLDATPKCEIPEPHGGWCPPTNISVSPTPSLLSTPANTNTLLIYLNNILRGLFGKSQ